MKCIPVRVEEANSKTFVARFRRLFRNNMGLAWNQRYESPFVWAQVRFLGIGESNRGQKQGYGPRSGPDRGLWPPPKENAASTQLRAAAAQF